MKHVLVDIETMGVNAYAPIVAIGAVEFDPYGQTQYDNEFYTVIDLQSCLQLGLRPDGATVSWWMKQGEKARLSLVGDSVDAMDISDALADFGVWYKASGFEKLWSFGYFDPMILGSAYEMSHIPCPFHYRHVMDARTLLILAGIPKTKEGGIEHHALDDAKRHARDVIWAYNQLALVPSTTNVPSSSSP